MKTRGGIVGAVGLLVGLWFGCNGSGGSGFDLGPPGSGGGGGSYTPPRCGQTCQDYLVGLALDQTVWLLFNENVAGTPSGNIDRSGSCPLGGTTHITGTTSVASNGVNTVHLVLSLTDCANSSSVFSLTFVGSVAIDGSYQNSTTKYTTVTISAPSLSVSGSLNFRDDPAITETCDVAETQQSSSGSNDSLNGRVCGREFSSATALNDTSGGTGMGGAAGTSNTGGAGTAGNGNGGSGVGGSGLGSGGIGTGGNESDGGFLDATSPGGGTMCCCDFGLDQYWHCIHGPSSNPNALCYVPWPQCCDQQWTLCSEP